MGIPAGDAARAQGVDAYDVLRATEQDIDARLLGRAAAHLLVHCADGVTVQRLDGRAPFELSTSPGRIEIGTGGAFRVVAEKDGDRWLSRGPLDADADARRSMRLLFAVDVDLAVQGSSIVLGGTAFARCTEECDRAQLCAETFEAASCAQHAVLCGGCLEQEP
jgi:hypothetical protein